MVNSIMTNTCVEKYIYIIYGFYDVEGCLFPRMEEKVSVPLPPLPLIYSAHRVFLEPSPNDMEFEEILFGGSF